ncbi:MAG TPA: hypothetical protein VMF06_22945 [Candidatus Limnocylindria bacterium]|nr:hypothetical protein [Candidatus Limnocylindria bacterium]
MRIPLRTSTAILAACLPALSRAAVVSETYTFGDAPLPLTPADGAGSPASDSRAIAGSAIQYITDIDVHFSLTNPGQAGAFNGDYYVSLQHESGFTILLNRVGRRGTTGSQALGYGDNGFDVTFDDQSSLGDIHLYRALVPDGSHTTPIDTLFVQPLSGTWAPDGRNTSPLTVLGTDPRNSLLSVFNGLPANGVWTLQVIDFNSGGTANLTGWGINVTGSNVPEAGASEAAALILLAMAFWRRGFNR